MTTSVESCLDTFRSQDASCREAALDELLKLDDPRVVKALEALVNDPYLPLAMRVREELATRTGEALGQKWVAPHLGSLGPVGCWKTTVYLHWRFPIILLGMTLLGFVLPVLVIGLLLILVGLEEAGVAFIKLSVTVSEGDSNIERLMNAITGITTPVFLSLTSALQVWGIRRLYLERGATLLQAVHFIRTRIFGITSAMLLMLLHLIAPLAAVGLVLVIAHVSDLRMDYVAPVACLFGAVAFVVQAVRYEFATTAAAADGLSARAALRTSSRLAGQFYGKIAGFLILSLLALATVSIPIVACFENSPFVQAALLSVAVSAMSTATALFYYDLVVRARVSGRMDWVTIPETQLPAA